MKKKQPKKKLPASTTKPKSEAGPKSPPSKSKASGNSPPRNSHAAIAVVGIGASAGGLDNFKQFFGAMPVDSGIAFVLIQHLDPTHESMIAELLSRHTKMPVVQLKDEMHVEANHVYVIPPNKYVSISGKTICLTEPVERRGLRVPIDYFLRSLAYDLHERAIGIIMSGAGTDGTLGVREIKAAGGMVIVQDPETAAQNGMPRSAIATGIVDHVIPVAKMPEVLARYVSHWYVNGDGTSYPAAEKAPDHLNSIIGLLRARIKYDFSCYKKGTLTRRIQRRMGLNHVEKMEEYVELLRRDTKEVTALYKDLLIGVTNFFREPESWLALEKQVITPLIQRQSPDVPIRVWVPGCATGEEPFSIAMVISEQLQIQEKSFPIQIFASDIDQDALAIARSGVYPENIAADITPGRLKQFFIKGEHTYRINKEIRDMVVFAEQNLVSDPPFSKLDLISCRNLMIYLEAEAQKKILALFHFAIREGGYLFLGGSETISQNHDLFEAVSRKHRLYRRVGHTRLDKIDFPIHRAEPPPRQGERLPSTEEPKARRLTALAHQLVLQRFAPACAVINRKGEVLYLHGPIDDFLQLPAGELGSDLLAMARDGLRTKLRMALHEVLRDDQRVQVGDVQVKRGRKYAAINITLEPIRVPKEAQGLLLVSFEDSDGASPILVSQDAGDRRSPGSSAAEAHETEGNYEGIIRQLEDELHTSREDLQSTIEELETSNEEFKAANEEVTSINEELQSTNEELETSKEELQSLNEELQTVNQQLEQKLNELESSNNDLNNLLASTDIATLFLDRQFRLKRFTPATTRIFRVIDSDIGRPIGDLTCDVMDESLYSDVEKVLDRLTPVDAEVRDNKGSTFVRHISPYRTEDNRIDGVVITFNDISGRKREEEALSRLNETLERRVGERTAQADSLVEEAPDAILIVDSNAHVVQVNRRAETMFGRDRKDIVGQSVKMLLPEKHSAGSAQNWQDYFAEPTPRSMGIGAELFGRRADGSLFPVEIQVNPLFFKDEQVAVASVRDVTERKQNQQAQAQLASIFNNSPASIMVLTDEGYIENWNHGAECLFGYTAKEAVGQHVKRLFAPECEGDFERISETIMRSGMVQDYETVGLRKNGVRIDISLTSSPATDEAGLVRRFCYVAYDIRERKRLEHQLASALDLERQRLGRELHDSLGQQMTGIGMLVALLKGQWRTGGQPSEVIAKLESSLEQAKGQLRSLAKGLFPVDVDARGLRIALNDMATELSDLYQVPCRFECPREVLLESNFTATQLYLFAREAVHNAAKHANAKEIVVRLELDQGIRLSIRDDGDGLQSNFEEKSTLGMRIMRYRCSLIGGTMHVETTQGGGTIVACSLQQD